MNVASLWGPKRPQKCLLRLMCGDPWEIGSRWGIILAIPKEILQVASHTALSCCNRMSANGFSLQQQLHLLLAGTFSGVFVNHTDQSHQCNRQITPVRSATTIKQV